MSNRYSRYIPLGYEPVQPPLNILAEVIKTKRQQNDTLSDYLDKIGQLRIHAIPGSFMEARAHDIQKGWVNEIDAITQEAINQHNGDFTALKGRIKKLGKDITGELTTGEGGAIDTAYQDYATKSKEYAADFKDDPMRLSNQQQQYLAGLKAPQAWDPITGRYPGVSSFTPPSKAFNKDELMFKSAAAVPMEEWETGSTFHGPMYDTDITTKSKFKDPNRIADALGTSLMGNRQYVEDIKWQAKNAAFQAGYAPGSKEYADYAEKWGHQKFEVDKNSGKEFGYFENVAAKDKKGKPILDAQGNQVFFVAPRTSTVSKDKDSGYGLLSAKRRMIEDMQNTHVFGEVPQRTLNLSDGVEDTPKSMGHADLNLVSNALDKLGYAPPAFSRAVSSNKKASEILYGTDKTKNTATYEAIKNAIQDSSPGMPVDESLLQKSMKEAADKGWDIASGIKLYNNGRTETFKKSGGSSKYEPVVFGYNTEEQRVAATANALANDDAPVDLLLNGKVIKRGKDGYTIKDMKAQYSDRLFDKSGKITADSEKHKAVGDTPPTPFNDVPSTVIQLGKGSFLQGYGQLTAFIHAVEPQFRGISQDNPHGNPVTHAFNQLNKGYQSGTSEPFRTTTSPNQELGKEINTAFGKQIITAATPIALKVEGRGDTGIGKRISTLKYRVYIPDKSGKLVDHGVVELSSVQNSLMSEYKTDFLISRGEQHDKVDAKGNEIISIWAN